MSRCQPTRPTSSTVTLLLLCLLMTGCESAQKIAREMRNSVGQMSDHFSKSKPSKKAIPKVVPSSKIPLVVAWDVDAKVSDDLVLTAIGHVGSLPRDLKKGRSGDNRFFVNYRAPAFARILGSGSRVRAMVNKKLEARYSSISSFRFSPNGQHWGYIGKKLSDLVLVIDGEVAHSFKSDEISFEVLPGAVVPKNSQEIVHFATRQMLDPQRLLFSDDGTHYAYLIAKNGTQTLYLNGKAVAKIPAGMGLGSLFFTSSNKLAYYKGIRHSTKEPGYFVLDGKTTIIPAKFGSEVVMSDDGQGVLLKVTQGFGTVVRAYLDNDLVFDINAAPYASHVKSKLSRWDVVFTPNLKHIGVRLAEKLWVDGKLVGPIRYIPKRRESTKFWIGSDGQHVFQKPDGVVVVNGKSGSDYYRLSGAAFATKAKAAICVVSTQAGRFLLDPKGKEYGPYSEINSLAISEDGHHFAYRIHDKVYLNGKLILNTRRSNRKVFDKAVAGWDASKIDVTTLSLLQEIGVKMKNLSYLNKFHAYSWDGRYLADFIKEKGEDRKTFYRLHVNGKPIGQPFKSMPYEMHFEPKSHNLRLLIARDKRLFRGYYTP